MNTRTRGVCTLNFFYLFVPVLLGLDESTERVDWSSPGKNRDEVDRQTEREVIIMAAEVSIAGIGGKVKVNTEGDNTVVGVLRNALRELGADETAADNLQPVVNGVEAELTDRVPDGAQVAAAPRVSNG